MFNDVPQVGDFVGTADVSKMNKLFHYLMQEVNKRRRYYSERGTTFLQEATKGECAFPNILVVLNGFDVFQEQYDDLYNDIFMPLVRDSNRFGIYFIITSAGSISVMAENSFQQKIAMRYLDISEYSMLFNNSQGIIPSINPGRGLVELDNVYEFQTAMIFDEVNFDYNLNYVVDQLKKTLTKAAGIPVMPRVVDYENVKDEIISLNMLPIGLDLSSNCVSSYDFSKFVNLVVYANEKMAVSFTNSLIKVMHDLSNVKLIVLDNIGVTSEFEDVQVFTANFKSLVEGLCKNITEKKSSDPTSQKVIFLISGYSKINTHLRKMKQEDESVLTIDDMIVAAANSENFKFILINDKNLKTIEDREWSDYLDYGYGIIIGTEKDEQSLIDSDDTYDEIKINKDTAIIVDDYKRKYVKIIRSRGSIE